MSRYWNKEGYYQELFDININIIEQTSKKETIKAVRNALNHRFINGTVYSNWIRERFRFYINLDEYKDFLLGFSPRNGYQYDVFIDDVMEKLFPNKCKESKNTPNRWFDYSKYSKNEDYSKYEE